MVVAMCIPPEIMSHIAEGKNISPAWYAYDTRVIRRNCSLFKKIPYTPTAIHFATMANTHSKILRIVREEGINVFVNSEEHMVTVESVGFSGNEIVFTASALNEDTMRRIAQRNVSVNLDSLGQLEQWWRLFPEKPVGIRCNIGSTVTPRNTRGGYFIGKESRLGLTLDEIYGLKGNTTIHGLHIYVGTDILDYDYFIECYERTTALAGLFPKLSYLDFGGGFGIDDTGKRRFDIKEYGVRVTELMQSVSNRMNRQFKLILEPGRIISGEAGYFICRVTDVKMRDEVQLIGVSASSVQFPRPLLHPDSAHHPVCLIRNNAVINLSNPLESSVYGCSTYSRDFLARRVYLPSAQINDFVVFGNAGSYCASAYTQFLGFRKAKEIFI